MKSVFFVPVFNQIRELPMLLDELHSTELACDTILFVNNGSSDGSAELIHQSGFEYIDVKENRGVGYGQMRAIEWALERNYDIMGTMAGNGKMLPSEMNRLLDPVKSGEFHLVNGSRFLSGGNYPNLPLFRRVSIPAVNVSIFAMYGVYLSDATCGYRAYHLDIIRTAEFDWRAAWLETYGIEYYLYAKVIASKHFRFKEAPVTMRYPEKGKPYSKIKPFSGWYQMLRPWVVARFDGKGFSRKSFD